MEWLGGGWGHSPALLRTGGRCWLQGSLGTVGARWLRLLWLCVLWWRWRLWRVVRTLGLPNGLRRGFGSGVARSGVRRCVTALGLRECA